MFVTGLGLDDYDWRDGTDILLRRNDQFRVLDTHDDESTQDKYGSEDSLWSSRDLQERVAEDSERYCQTETDGHDERRGL